MTDMKPSDREITIGNGDKVATQGQGTVTLTDKLGHTIKLTDVYYAPTFTKHIVSMRKLIDENWAFHVTDKTAFVFMDPATKGTAGEVWSEGQGHIVLLHWYSKCRSCQQSARAQLDDCPSHFGHQHRAWSTWASTRHEDGYCYGKRTWLDTKGISATMWFLRTGQGSCKGNTQEHYDKGLEARRETLFGHSGTILGLPKSK